MQFLRAVQAEPYGKIFCSKKSAPFLIE